jgi:hypothetical protein
MKKHEKVPAGDNIPEESPGDERTRREMIALWTSILAGPLLWFAHQQVCFLLVPWVCVHGGVVWLHLTTVLCLAGVAAAGALAWRYRRPEHCDWDRGGLAAAEVTRPGTRDQVHSKERTELPPSSGEQRVRFMAMLGLLSSGFFALVIVAQGLPNFFLDPCQR